MLVTGLKLCHGIGHKVLPRNAACTISGAPARGGIRCPRQSHCPSAVSSCAAASGREHRCHRHRAGRRLALSRALLARSLPASDRPSADYRRCGRTFRASAACRETGPGPAPAASQLGGRPDPRHAARYSEAWERRNWDHAKALAQLAGYCVPTEGGHQRGVWLHTDPATPAARTGAKVVYVTIDQDRPGWVSATSRAHNCAATAEELSASASAR